MRVSFGVRLPDLGLLLAAATAGYVASSFASGRLLRHVSLGVVLSASCALTGIALLGYGAAAHWIVVLGLAVCLGVGAGAIDAGLNTYIATHYGARMLNWLHGCFGIGAASGPLIMTAFLRRGASWRAGYVLVGAAQVALAACFALTRRAWPEPGPATAGGQDRHGAPLRSTLRLPAAWLGMAVFVAYAGLEASIGAWTYTLLTEGRGLPTAQAGLLASLFWGGMTGGRLLAAAAGGYLSPQRLLRLMLVAATAGTVLVLAAPGPLTAGAGLLLAGVACGPIFPSMIAATPEAVGPAHAPNAVGFQIAASALGLSFVPGIVGAAAAAFGMETIPRVFVGLAAVLLIITYASGAGGTRAAEPRAGEPAAGRTPGEGTSA